MKLILSLFFLVAFAICVQSQVTTQRVIYTTSNPPTVCVAGKVYTNSTVKKSWLGGSDSSCNPYAMGSSAAPTDATYITQTPNATLSAEQALSALASGLLKNHTGDGVLSIGAAGTDYVAPGAVPISAPLFCSDAGSTDAYACSLSPVPTLVTGTHYRFKANTANTGAATINFNSLGAVTIKKVAGGITTDLADNDIRVGQWIDLVYDGTNFQMQSTLGNVAGASVNPTSGTVPINTAGSFVDSLISQGTGSVLVPDGTKVGWSGGQNPYFRYNSAGDGFLVTYNAAAQDLIMWRYDGMFMRSDARLVWNPSNPASTTGNDLGIVRTAPKVASVSDGGANSNGWLQDAGAVRLTADFTNATTTLNNTGLSLTLQAGRIYTCHAVLFLANSTAGEGVKFDFGGGAATSTNFIMGSGSALLASTQTSLTGLFSAATVTGTNAEDLDGTFEVNAGGTFIIRAAEVSHVAGTLSVLRGSYLQCKDTP